VVVAAVMIALGGVEGPAEEVEQRLRQNITEAAEPRDREITAGGVFMLAVLIMPPAAGGALVQLETKAVQVKAAMEELVYTTATYSAPALEPAAGSLAAAAAELTTLEVPVEQEEVPAAPAATVTVTVLQSPIAAAAVAALIVPASGPKTAVTADPV
jgi:hypothetical protein